ncbi:hypothetical protein Y1Q_0019268 [Alligator mississippiensis]|uniref:Uncharacterized protein n=1 Tax=Alligator mississippiensis TaxID=8496 RepID=A0A151MQP0_ALLMI|nr:hypothetical protein Y1Q_0019268 [Alligator mississippiensis]
MKTKGGPKQGTGVEANHQINSGNMHEKAQPKDHDPPHSQLCLGSDCQSIKKICFEEKLTTFGHGSTPSESCNDQNGFLACVGEKNTITARDMLDLLQLASFI